MSHPNSCICCTKGPEVDRAEMRHTIEKWGHAVRGVSAEPPFAYTVGLWARGLPEVIIMGLPAPTSAGFLNMFVQYMEMAGPPSPGDLVDAISTMPFLIGSVCDRQIEERMRTAIEFADPMSMGPIFESNAPKALQLIWSDREGRFPNHLTFSNEFAGRQVMLNNEVEHHHAASDCAGEPSIRLKDRHAI